MKGSTTDALFDGQLMIEQSKKGYRFSLDPVILAHFASPVAGSRIIDLGTGCGVIPLILAHRETDLMITGVEVQDGLARLAALNVLRNNKEESIRIVHMDMKDYSETYRGELFDLVITNPPYTKKNAGRVNPDSERAIARHELKITLKGLLETASERLRDKGVFAIVYPEARLHELLELMTDKNLKPERLRLVCAKKGAMAKLALVRGVKNGVQAITIDAPLYIYDLSGRYTPEMEMMFR